MQVLRREAIPFRIIYNRGKSQAINNMVLFLIIAFVTLSNVGYNRLVEKIIFPLKHQDSDSSTNEIYYYQFTNKIIKCNTQCSIEQHPSLI